jgi:thiamine biosynthesis protein ThiI
MKRGILLISGGIDSPVAGYLMKKRGFDIIAVHFSNDKFAGPEPEQKSRKLAKKIGVKKYIVVDISNILKEIAEKCDQRYYFVLMKRLMYRLAEKIAAKEKCGFLITGENLAQVSSQTLQNLVVINKAVSIPVLRPLIAYDKMEIVALAEKIDTFETSKGPEMCDVLGSKHPSTQSQESAILGEEKKVNMVHLLETISI